MLIADSGSTKTEWRYVSGSGPSLHFRTAGLNPTTMPANMIEEELSRLMDKFPAAAQSQRIYFYSTGTGHPDKRAWMKHRLEKTFVQAEATVESDLMAAVRSTGRVEGVVCILGTGSNACWYRNGKIMLRKGGLGYILGDEGSGADLGKHLLKGILEENFPEEITQYIELALQSSIPEIMRELYQNPKPNTFLANMAQYIEAWQSQESIQLLLRDRFEAFLKSSVIPLGRIDLPVDFVGSIAYYFSDALEEVCDQYRLDLGQCLKDPMEGLIQWHQRNT